ncbi:MAG: SMI1/KNR4 family protein [Cyanobacteria bacterium J06634_6]
MKGAIATHWDKIEQSLSQYAPDVLNSLRPGATVSQVSQAEQTLEIELPMDVVISYLLHDGQERYGGGLFYRRWSLLSIEGIVSEWQGWMSLARNGEAYWHQLWIPIAHDFGGNNYSIDLDPHLGDDIGRIIHTDHETISEIESVVASSLQELLFQLASDLETGEYNFLDL